MKSIKLVEVMRGRNDKETLENLVNAYTMTIKQLEFEIAELQKRIQSLGG